MDLNELINKYKNYYYEESTTYSPQFLQQWIIELDGNNVPINNVIIVETVNSHIEIQICIYEFKENIKPVRNVKIKNIHKKISLEMIIKNYSMRGTVAKIILTPKFGLTNNDYNSMVFKKISHSKVLKQILRRKSIDCSVISMELDKEKEFFIQYEETERNFFNRICKRVGCRYYLDSQGKVFISDKFHDSPAIEIKTYEILQIEYCLNYNETSVKGYDPSNPEGLVKVNSKERCETSSGYEFFYEEFTSDKDAIKLAKHWNKHNISEFIVLATNEEMKLFNKVKYKGQDFFVLSILAIYGSQKHKNIEYDFIVILGNALPLPDCKNPLMKIERATICNNNNKISMVDKDTSKIFAYLHFDKKNVIPITCSQNIWGGSNNSRFIPRNQEEILVCFEYNNPDRPVCFRSLNNKKNKPDNNNIEEEYMRFYAHDGNSISKDKFNELRFINNAKKPTLKLESSHNIHLKSKDILFECETFTVKCKKYIKIEADENIDLKTRTMNLKSSADTNMNNDNLKIESNMDTKISNMNTHIRSKTDIKMSAMKIACEATIEMQLKALMIKIESTVKLHIKSLITDIKSQVKLESNALINRMTGLMVMAEANVMMKLQSAVIMQIMCAIRMSNISAIDMSSGGILMFANATVIFSGFALAPNGFFKIGCPFP